MLKVNPRGGHDQFAMLDTLDPDQFVGDRRGGGALPRGRVEAVEVALRLLPHADHGRRLVRAHSAEPRRHRPFPLRRHPGRHEVWLGETNYPVVSGRLQSGYAGVFAFEYLPTLPPAESLRRTLDYLKEGFDKCIEYSLSAAIPTTWSSCAPARWRCWRKRAAKSTSP